MLRGQNEGKVPRKSLHQNDAHDFDHIMVTNHKCVCVLFSSSMCYLPCQVCRLRVERPHPSKTELIYTNLIFPMSNSVIKVLKDI